MPVADEASRRNDQDAPPKSWCSALRRTWPDLDFDSPQVRITKSLEQTAAGLRVKSPKTKRTHVITLPQSVYETLKFHRERQEENRRLLQAHAACCDGLDSHRVLMGV